MVVEFWFADPIPLLEEPLLDEPVLDEPVLDVDVEPVLDEPVLDVEPDVVPEPVLVCELPALVVFAADSVTPAMTVAVSAAPTAATTPLATFARRRSRAARSRPCGSYSVMDPGCGPAGQGHLTEASSHS